MIEILNRVTLAPPPPPKPVTLSVDLYGHFRLSEELYRILGEPLAVELLRDKNRLFIKSGDAETGFVLTDAPGKNQCKFFRCKELLKKVFKGAKAKYVVFTEPVDLSLSSVVFEIKMT